jgi:hypothetical protein
MREASGCRLGAFCIERNEGMKSLKDFTTKELVEELTKREGVDKTTAAPYEEKIIEVSGPAVVLTVID